MASNDSSGSGSAEPQKTGFLFKQGGGYRNWKKRYFVLQDSTLFYYTKEGEDAPKGTIDLTTGRGVRAKEQCKGVEVWPKEASDDNTFGLSVEKRTYFIYGKDKEDVKEWMKLLQQRIEKIGNPTNSYENDPEGKPESIPSKLVKQGSKLAATFTKAAVRTAAATGAVDADTVDLVEGVADAVENQADAGRDATLADRIKMGAGDSAGLVSDNVDNTYVSTAASVVQEQVEADEDASLQQRVLMSTGTALGGAAEVIGEENEIAGGIVGMAGGVVSDQAEADEDMSVKQRLVLAGGSALGEGSGMVGDMTDLQVVADAMEVAGEVVKGQAEADEESSLKERVSMGVGTGAEATAGLDSMRYNHNGKMACREVESLASGGGD